MASEASLLRMIGRIYESATDPHALQDLANDFSREFSCNTALVYVVQNPRGRSTDVLLSATATFDDWAHASYTGYYRQRDVWGRGLIAKSGRAAALHGMELIERPVLERSEIYADYYRKTGIEQVLIGSFNVASDLGVVSISRPGRGQEFDDQDKGHLNVLVPHLQRALDIQQRLSAAEQQRALSFEVLERLALGVIVVDVATRVLLANSVARDVLRANDTLTVLHNSLRARHSKQASRFETLLRDTALTSIGAATVPGGIIALRGPAGTLPVMVAPYRPPAGADGHFHGAALVIFSDPRTKAVAPENALAEMFGLSPAEARLACALVGGETLGSFADRVGVSANTCKTQMRQIFYKTGYNRQTDLVRAALQNPIIRLTTR